MTENDSPIIVGLDIGTTKIAAIAGRKNEQGKLEILAFGRSHSYGVHHGDVQNIDEATEAIKQALKNCELSNEDLEIKEVYVGIAGHHIKSLQTRGDIVRQDSEIEIQSNELELLINNQKKSFIPAGDEIIEVIPMEFNVDNIQNIKKYPTGYNGVRVGANFHIITGDRNAIRNIKRAVERSSLITKDLVLQPLASASAVMSEVDMEAGVAIVDIGGGTSDLAVFYEGILKHTKVIPFGGENITNDIKKTLGVLKAQAEAMKVLYGTAVAALARPNEFITIPSVRGLPPKEISVRNLSLIIEARMTEILEFVCFSLNQMGIDNSMLNGGIILTGGGSQLKHLIQLTEHITKLNARIGYPNEHLSQNHIDELKKPMYATCIGLILKGYDDFEHKYKKFSTTQKDKTVVVPEALVIKQKVQAITTPPPPVQVPKESGKEKIRDNRKSIWSGIKTNLLELFSEEGDKEIK